MKSTDILEKCVHIQNERAKEYNSPEGERSMDTMVEAFNALTGHKLSVADGWLFMMVLKLVRGRSSPGHVDSAVDLASYASLYGEEQLRAAQPSAPSEIQSPVDYLVSDDDWDLCIKRIRDMHGTARLKGTLMKHAGVQKIYEVPRERRFEIIKEFELDIWLAQQPM